MNPDIITHIYEDKSEIYSLTQKKHFSESEDEIPEYELLKMMQEVEEEEEYLKEVDAILNGDSQQEILDVAKEQNRVAHHKGKTIRPKKSKKVQPPVVCYKSPLDKTMCKVCYRKFMDTNPLATAVFTDASFAIVAVHLD